MRPALIDPGERAGGHRESFLVAGHCTELLQGGDRGLEAGQRRVDQLLAESLRPRDRGESLIEQDAENALRLQGVAILRERPLDQRLGLLARLSLLLEGVGLGVPGGDRIILRDDRRPLARLCVRLRPFLLLVGLGEFCVERLQGRGERHRPGRDRDPHQHDRRGQAGDAGVAPAPPPDGAPGRPRGGRRSARRRGSGGGPRPSPRHQRSAWRGPSGGP